MDDTSLCQLIRQALHSPEKAEALALVIDQLPEVKVYLGRLGLLPYYDKALPVTERDVQRNINRFPQMYCLNLETADCQNPSETADVRKFFINWVMMILKRDCYDIKRGRKRPIVSINNPIGRNDELTIEETIADTTLTGIERLLEEERLFLGRTIRHYIEEDPEMKLRNCYMRDRPDINCQVLLQKRFLQNPPLTLKEIANELQTKVPNIQSRLERNCLPLLIEIATTLGCK